MADLSPMSGGPASRAVGGGCPGGEPRPQDRYYGVRGAVLVRAGTSKTPGGRSLIEVAIAHPDRQPAVASAVVAACTAMRQQVALPGSSSRASVGEVWLFGLLMMWVAVLAGTTALGFPATMAAAGVLTAGPLVVVESLSRAWVRTVPVERLPANYAELVRRAVRHHLEVAAAADATGLPELRAAARSTQHGLWDLAPLLRNGRPARLGVAPRAAASPPVVLPLVAQRIVDRIEVVARKARETRQAHEDLLDATSPGSAAGEAFVAGRLVASLARMQAANGDLDVATTALRVGAGVVRELDQTVPAASRPDPQQSAVTGQVDGGGA